MRLLALHWVSVAHPLGDIGAEDGHRLCSVTGRRSDSVDGDNSGCDLCANGAIGQKSDTTKKCGCCSVEVGLATVHWSVVARSCWLRLHTVEVNSTRVGKLILALQIYINNRLLSVETQLRTSAKVGQRLIGKRFSVSS